MTRSTTLPRGRRALAGRGTFIYLDYTDNHVIWRGRKAALKNFVHQTFGGIRHKVRPAYSSNSEDALTWSCFDTLAQLPEEARRRALTDIWELTFGDRNAPEGVLSGEIHIGKRYGQGESTEIDASIEGPDVIVFIEAKLYSTMSAADPDKRKPHNQIERKIRIGLREAARCNSRFFFILLDIAPLEALRSLSPGVSLAKAMMPNATKPKATGFRGKWMTAYWFARYKYGSRGSLAPLQKLLADSGFPDMRAKEVARKMGWLTWSDLFKSVLRSAIPTV